jgi:glyoxalase family protein
MAARVDGIHHITSGAAAAQEDIDFFTKVVGQRMIKQTVLFDGSAPIYHLYYANKNAEVGSVMTSFPFKQAGLKGRRGTGQIRSTVYSVPARSASGSSISTSTRCPTARSANASVRSLCPSHIPPASSSR